MTERSVAIIGKGMIGISMAVLFTGNGIPTIVLAKNAEVGLEKYRTYYRDLVGQGLVTERQAAAVSGGCPSRSPTRTWQT